MEDVRRGIECASSNILVVNDNLIAVGWWIIVNRIDIGSVLRHRLIVIGLNDESLLLLPDNLLGLLNVPNFLLHSRWLLIY